MKCATVQGIFCLLLPEGVFTVAELGIGKMFLQKVVSKHGKMLGVAGGGRAIMHSYVCISTVYLTIWALWASVMFAEALCRKTVI